MYDGSQKSHDHRGTPEVGWATSVLPLMRLQSSLFYTSQSPGRVVTLVHMEDWEEFSASVSALFLESSVITASDYVTYRTHFLMKMWCGVSSTFREHYA